MAPSTRGNPDHESENESVETQLRTPVPSSQSDPLIRILEELKNRSGNRSLSRVNDPSTFSGRNRQQLRLFLGQCEAVFVARESEFNSARSKITFTGTYFTDLALEWYLQVLPELNKFESWTQFTKVLSENFGDTNEVAKAERQLDQLRMGNSQECITYVTRFRTLAAIIQWKDDKPLISAFRRGLPDRILDDIMRMRENPETLDDYINMSLEIDGRYWESQAFKTARNSRSPSETPSGNTKGSSAKPSANIPSATSTSRQSSERSAPKHLTSDFHLTKDERDKRFRNGECLYCGNRGHTLSECPKRKPSSSKPANSAPSGGSPKNI